MKNLTNKTTVNSNETTLSLTIQEFLQFRETCKKFNQTMTNYIKNGLAIVTVSTTFLISIGYEI